jgi:thiamine-monophosphate kinase
VQSDEDEITARLKDIFATTLTAEVRLGIGDDCAILETPRNSWQAASLVSTDILIEGVHFRREWSDAKIIAERAFAQNLADIAAMGGRGVAMLVALGVSPDISTAFLMDFAEAFADAARKNRVAVIGGDLANSSVLSIAVTVLGATDGREAIQRRGAKPGDLVAVCGELGSSALGFQKLNAATADGANIAELLDSACVRDFLCPQPNYAQGIWAAKNGVHAMIDISDGLVKDASRIARASGVSIKLFPAPERDEIARQAYYFGGEDHALLACFPTEVELNDAWKIVGEVADGSSKEVIAEDLTDADFAKMFDHCGGGIYV